MNAARIDNSAASQRSRILRYPSEVGPITTLQCRHKLDSMHPGMRICELRKIGFPIEIVWTDDLTPEGKLYRVTKYILCSTRLLSLLDLPENSIKKED